MAEKLQVQERFKGLCKQELVPFPECNKRLAAPAEPGVYVIRKRKTVLHVGRTLRGKGGLHKRLKDHLYGRSSFTKRYLKGNKATLRKNGYTYQYLVVKASRLRALLEAYAVGILCPRHIGLGNRER